MILPVIHMNGTGAQDLFDGYSLAADAVQLALERVGAIEFNSRDYYCHPEDGAWTKAVAQRMDLVKKLAEVHAELMAHVAHIQEQMDERERLKREREH